MTQSWFVRGDGRVWGPIDSQRLKQLVADSKIDERTDVSQNFAGPWVPAGSVRGLFPPKPPPEPPALAASPWWESSRVPSQHQLLPKEKTPFTKTWTGIGLIWGTALFLLLVARALQSAAGQRRADAMQKLLNSPVAAVESSVLVEMFEQNPLKAEQLLKGRAIDVSGTVNSIGKGLSDTPYISIGKGLIGSVKCTFSTNFASAVAEMTKGERVTVRGIVEGQNIMRQVELNECRPSAAATDQ
jgi:hypothetical protein